MNTAEKETIRTAIDLLVLKALIATHPNPSQLRTVFDQLLGQFQANPVVLQNPEFGDLIRRKVADIFAPPVQLDTEHPDAPL